MSSGFYFRGGGHTKSTSKGPSAAFAAFAETAKFLLRSPPSPRFIKVLCGAVEFSRDDVVAMNHSIGVKKTIRRRRGEPTQLHDD